MKNNNNLKDFNHYQKVFFIMNTLKINYYKQIFKNIFYKHYIEKLKEIH